MKERREVAMLKESAKNKDVNGAPSLRDIKDEVKDEPKGHSARSTPDTKPPSNKMANGESDTPKSEDSNKNKIVTEGVKEENGGPMSVGSDNKRSPAGAGNLGGQGGPATSRSETSMPGFIQQQSTIFVFSTAMANQGAEYVKMGKHNSLIGFHMECPSTQQNLAMQKAQGKAGQGGRAPNYSNMPQKPGMTGMPGMGPGGSAGPDMGGPGMGGPGNNMGGPGNGMGGPGSSMNGPGSGMGGPGMGGPGGGMGGMGGPGMGTTVEQWVQEQNANLQQQQNMPGMPGYPMTSTSMGPSGPTQGPGCNSMCAQGMMPGAMGGTGGAFPMVDSLYEFNPDAVGPGGAVSMPHMNLSQNKVPNESLTSEQLKHRSEKIGQLTKIKGSLEMHGLLDSGDMGMGGPMSRQQSMMSQQQAMMSHQQAMMGGPSPGQPHPGMMSPSQQYMMQQQQQAHNMRMEGSYPPGHPANFRGPGPGMGGDMSQMQAHQAWMRMRQEFYEGKMQQRSQQQAAMMGGMGPQHPMNGPPPPYYSTMGGKRQPGPMGMVGSPTSPGSMMDGSVEPPFMFPSARSRPGMPMDPQAMEAMGPGGFGPGPSGMPPHSMPGGMGMMPGMEGPMMPGMGPQGPMVSGPMMPGRGGPGPVMGSSGSGGVNVVSSTPGRKSAASAQVTLHRAGNPEQFTPDPNSANVNSTGGKPPPSYAQAQKRKRDDMEDPYKNLQPTPSPTPLTYLNQFEGQELTITKQLNSAFRESAPGTGPSAGGGGAAAGMTPHDPNSVPPSTHPHNTQFSSPASNSNPVNSPMPHVSNPGGNPPSVKNPMSNSSQTSSTGHLGSPGTLHHPPGPSPLSGASMRLSHFDPPATNTATGPSSTAANGSGGMSSAPATPTAAVGAKQQPAGITSTALANLQKGMEHITSNFSQMQGGPFHSIQVQGQVGNSGANGSSTNSTATSHTAGQPQSGSSVQSCGPPGTPKQFINNTNISQVNNFFGTGAPQSSLEVHPMVGEGPNVSMASGAGSSVVMTSTSNINGSMVGPGPGPGPVPGPGMPREAGHREAHMQQQQQQQHAAMMMTGGPGGMGASMTMSQAQMQSGGSVPPTNAPMASMQPGMSPSSQVKSPPYSSHQPHPHPLPHPSMSTGMHQPGMSNSMGGTGNRLTSPSFPSSSVGNASVHIQPKAPNTIQYLPANPPPTQQPPSQSAMPVGGPPSAKRAATEMEMMARYSSPMDMKGNPSSTLQYFPSSPPNHTMRPHPGTGPHPGAGVPPNGPMPDFSPQQSMEIQQAMMMRGMGPGGPGPQDFGPMGPMGQGMHPGMSMGPNGPVPSSMHSPLGSMDRMDMSGMGSPMEAVMMGPSPSVMRHVSALGPGGSGSVDPMNSMMGHGGGPPSGAYPAGAPSGYMPNGQSMMMGQPMQGPGPSGPPGHPGSMPGMPMSHSGMPRMPGGPSGMRMQMPGGPGPGGSGGYSAQYQQFQQQLYAQGRSRQMSPMTHMIGAGPPGPGQPYMGMMPPNMPGPS